MDLADESSAAAYAQRSEAGGSPSLQRRAAPGSPLIGRMRASDELPLGDGSPRSRRRLLERMPRVNWGELNSPYLFKEQGQTPSATVAMMRPPATLQP